MLVQNFPEQAQVPLKSIGHFKRSDKGHCQFLKLKGDIGL